LALWSDRGRKRAGMRKATPTRSHSRRAGRPARATNVCASARCPSRDGFPALVARRHLDLLVLWFHHMQGSSIFGGTWPAVVGSSRPHSPLHRSFSFTARPAWFHASGCRTSSSTPGPGSSARLAWSGEVGHAGRHLRPSLRLLRQICGRSEAPSGHAGRHCRRAPFSTCGLSSTPSSAMS